ncbi:hypothetical protein EBS80_01890 [bacterium]|nr:hypothetical protein [bacterium]
MIAEVYPIKRMPRRFGVFDYEIPAGMELVRGQFVYIPFRTGEMMGVVARVKEGGGRGIELKQVRAIVPNLSLADAELGLLEALAFDLAQSVPALLHTALPRPVRESALRTRTTSGLSLTIPAREAPSVTLLTSHLGQRHEAFVSVPDLKRSAAIVATYAREHADEPVMVLLPNVRDVRLIAGRLTKFDPLVVTGEESDGDRFRAWSSWRKRGGMLVGTRTAALWTNPKTGAVFVLRANHPNHKQQDRNPRLNARDAARLIAEQFHARLIRMDVAPSTDDVRTCAAGSLLGADWKPQTTVLDMTTERIGSPHSFLAQTTMRRIEDTLAARRRVICAYNRKGVSRRLQCGDCQYRFPCPKCDLGFVVYQHVVRCHHCGHTEPTPLSCPRCRGKKLTPKGFGNRTVAAALQALYPEATVSCIEKGSEMVAGDRSDILVVTRHYLENVYDAFDPPDVGLVIDLDADLSLYEPTYRATEQSLLGIEEWRGIAYGCRADLLVQTEVPELFRQLLTDPRRMLEDDLKTREAYGQPPFRRKMSVDIRTDEPRERDIALRTLSERVASVAPKTSAVQSDALELSVPPEEEQTVLRAFSTLDDRYIIDTRLLE